MLTTVSHIFQLFGAPVVVPVMIFVVALLRVTVKTAMMSAFYAGVGLTGFTWIIGTFTPVVTTLVKQLVHQTGIQLPVVDIGWQAGSLAAFSSGVGLSFFVLGLLLEFLLFAIGLTKVFMPVNLWNNFGFMIWGTMAVQVTHQFWLGLGLASFLLLVTLLLAEVQADAWSDYFGVENATVAAPHNIEQVVPILLLDPLWNRLGLNHWHWTPASLKARLGVFGEPTTLGIVLGVLIGGLANLNRLTSLTAWGQIVTFAVQLAAVMTIFPLVTQVFAQAFTPLATAMNRQQTSQNAASAIDRSKRWFLAVDDGVGYGESATIIAGVLLIPIMVGMAFILPGNRTLPVVDLIALPFMVESMVALTHGNLAKVVATGTIWFSLGLYASSWVAPMYTAAVVHYGIALPTGVVLLTSFNLMARPLNVLIFAAWISQNPLWIGLTLVIYAGCEWGLHRHRETIWHYLRQMAAANH